MADWHENILTPGWQWVSGVVLPGSASDNISNPVVSGVPGPNISFNFDQLFPGSTIIIKKELQWIGFTDPAAGANTIWGDGQFDSGAPLVENDVYVEQFPTPEPSACMLALLGLLGLLGAGIRRRIAA